jgi:hypothetical protein
MSSPATAFGAITKRRGSESISDRQSSGPLAARRKFLRYFPEGFRDQNYLDWERSYKWNAHQQWEELLNRTTYRKLLHDGEFSEAAARAIRIESRTNLLFSFEKMALRDAVRSPKGAKGFAIGLYDFLHGPGDPQRKFARWCEVLAGLPRRQTRVLTWPVVTVFGFIALPGEHVFLKPNVTRIAADAYGVDFLYHSRPAWETYSSLLDFAKIVRNDIRDFRPRDMIDLQSFIWVQGSDEYPD